MRSLKLGETVWDAAVTGFAARRQKGDAIAYVLKYRTAEGRQRWHTIGRHGAPWTPDKAREEAQRLLGEVAKGGDPAADKKALRKAATVAELCDLYLTEALEGRVLKRSGAKKKSTTLAIDRGRIDRHIKPLLGTYAITAVTRRDVERFLHDVAGGKTRAQVKTKARGLARVTGGKTAANRSVGLLGAIFTFAARLGLRPDNPVQGSQRFADTTRERRLSNEEYAALGEALHEALHKAEEAHIWPAAVQQSDFWLSPDGGEAKRLVFGGLKWTSLGPRHCLATRRQAGRCDRSPAVHATSWAQ